jgi:hypothetical protein
MPHLSFFQLISFYFVLSLPLEFKAGAVGFTSKAGNFVSLFQRVFHRSDVELHPLLSSLFLFIRLLQCF